MGNVAPICADEQITDVFESRAAFYELLASFYFYPLAQEQIDALADVDFTSYAEVNEEFSEGAQEIVSFLQKRNSGTRERLAIDYASAFEGRHTFKGRYAEPYESLFTNSEQLLMQGNCQEVCRIYASEGVKRKDGFDWPDDHLSVMFQFMAVISRRCAEALSGGDAAAAIHCLDTSSDFLRRHIASWFSDFMALADVLLKTAFYKGILKITKGYIDFDAEVLADLSASIKGA